MTRGWHVQAKTLMAIIVMGFGLFTESVAARELLVAARGGAYRSIQKALNDAKPGDVIVVSGTVREYVKTVRSGHRGRPITIRGGSNARLVAPKRYKGRLLSIYHNYIRVENMTIEGGDILVYIFGGSGNVLSRNTIQSAGGECVRVRYLSRSNLISGNVIRNCGRTGFGGGHKNGEGVYVGTAPEQLKKNARERVPGNAARGKPTARADSSDANRILNNRIHVPAECVDIKEGSSQNRVEGNICSGNRDVESAGFSSRGDNNSFIRNVTTGRLAGAGVRLGGDRKHQGVNNIVIGNDLRNTGGYALKDERSQQGKICGNRIGDNAKGKSKSGRDPSDPC